MPFLDWWGFLGTGIQSTFAWIGYNRDAFADNVSMRQAQKYQQKNYHISWIAIARDDIRDMMGISVNRINNYMIVATLILSVAAGAVTGVSFNEHCPTFIMFTFYLSIGLSLVYLMLAIMFGVKGQNSAFTNTMKLLTYQVRPENPAEYSHDYMKQAQWIERQGLSALFRIPGILPSYGTDAEGDKALGVEEKLGTLKKAMTHRGTSTFAGIGKQGKRPQFPGSEANKPASKPVNLEDSTPLESLVQRTTHTWYLTKFTQFMRLWQPYDTFSKYSMGLGIICLGQGSAYFCLGRISSEQRFLDEWAAVVLTFAFVYMVLLVTMENFKVKSPHTRRFVIFLLTAGPCFGAIGAVTQYRVLKQIVIPLCFLCHTLFWLFGFVFTVRELKDEPEPANATEFWKRKDDAASEPSGMWPSGPGRPDQHGEYLREAAGEEIDPQYYDYSRQQEQHHHGYYQEHPEQYYQHHGYQHHGYQQDQHYGRPPMPQWQTAPPSWQGRAKEQSYGRPQELGHQRPERAAQLPAAAAQGNEGTGNPSDHWPTDDEEFHDKASSTNVHIKQTVRYTLAVSTLLWLAMFFWAVAKWWVDPVSMTIREAMGSPHAVLAGELPVVWPNPLFRPRAIACAASRIYATDGFRIFELPQRGGLAAAEVPCALDRPIVDIAVSCIYGGCSPVALVAGGLDSLGASEVVDCASGRRWPLLQDEWPAERVAILDAGVSVANLTERRLVTLRGAEMVQFLWSGERQGFVPEWLLGSSELLLPTPGSRADAAVPEAATTAHGGLSGASVGQLLLWRTTSAGRPALEVRDHATMALRGRWLSPPTLGPIAGACALSQGVALVLPASAAAEGGDRPRLLQVTLR